MFKIWLPKKIILPKASSIKSKNQLFLDMFLQYKIEKSDYLLNNIENSKEYTNNIYANIKNIKKTLINNKNILCWGDVQSGKTDNIIANALSFLDEDFSIVIIVGGHTSSLYEQTNQRIQEINLNQKLNNFYYLNKNSFNLDIDLKEELNKHKLLINIPKLEKDLKKLLNLINASNLADIKIAIFDDESDYGSINIGDPSSIYEKLISILNRKDNSKFIQITATPYANLMSSKSIGLFPSAIVKFKSSKNYTGNHFFNIPKNNIYDLDKNIDKTENINKLIEETLYIYFFSAALFELQNQTNDKYEFLVNVHKEIKKHKDTKKIIEKTINNKIKNTISHIKNTESLKECFKKEISFFEKRNIDLNEYINEEFLSTIKNIINNNQVVLFNSDTNNNESKTYKSGSYKSTIVVGGALLSRGITFQYLLVNLMINVPKKTKISADTLLQRARWFGYRKTELNRYKYMTVIVNENTRKTLFEIRNIDKKLVSFFTNNILEEENFIKVILYLKKMNKAFDEFNLTSNIKRR